MNKRRNWIAAGGVLAIAAVAAAPSALAQGWPRAPIKMVVTFPPGGSSDIVARVLGPLLAERLGQSVVIDNRPGAGATIGAKAVADAPADGYTLMLSNTAPISISPFMLDKPPYDPVKGFTHVFYIGAVPNVFAVHPSVPVRTMAEFTAWLKAQKDPVPFGSGGVGSIGHIVGEIFKNNTGTQLNHVPYKGSGPMHNDLLGGTIKVAVDSLPQNLQYMKGGQLRLLAVTSRERMSMAPDLPTVAEAGYPNLIAENFLGISGPAGLPREVVDAIHRAMAEVIRRPDVVRKLDDLGISPRAMSPAEFTRFVADQVSAWAPAVKSSGARLN
ncbi:MAG: tripartite tricarboxylate transporter substrate binding protein [Burkholderiales bacterium]|nr:tripartite tricarboxylate transporter substrate binding protein [Burkholderiales bacterium]